MKTIATAAGTPALPRPSCLRAVFTSSALSALLLNGIWLGKAHADDYRETMQRDAKETQQEVISEGTRDTIKEAATGEPDKVEYDLPTPSE